MASILDISETFLENFVDGLSHPEHAAHSNIEFNSEEENLCHDLLDALNLLASPSVFPLNVTAHHVVGQNFSVLGDTNFDTDDISCGSIIAEQAAPDELTSQTGQNLGGLGYISYDSGCSSSNIDFNVVGGSVMRAEQAAPDTSSCTFSWNDGGDAMQVEEALLREITSKVCQNLDGLGCVNHDSGWSSSNASWNGMTKLNSLCDPLLKQKKSNSTLRELRLARKKKNSANDSNASVTGAHTLKVQHCEPDVDVAIDNHQLEKLPSHERTAKPVDSTEQSEDASQLDKSQVQLIGKSIEIPLQNASKGRRNESTHNPCACAECGKEYNSKYYLAIHTRVHTGEKPYKCALCDYACIAGSGLTRHKKTHSDTKPYKCVICNGTFQYKIDLTKHQRTHSDKTPFTCDICNRSFWRKAYLTNHKNAHYHAEKLYECDVCNKTYYGNAALFKHQKRHQK